jgi:hypothetical protein
VSFSPPSTSDAQQTENAGLPLPSLALPADGAGTDASEVPPVSGLTVLQRFYHRLQPTSVQLEAFLPEGDVPDPLPKAVVAKLQFRPVSLLAKRGLTPESCEALGFRASLRSNEKLLLELRDEFLWEQVVESGLWLEGNHQRQLNRRPNKQYCGKGQIGKKPKPEQRDSDDKWQWGWCEPALIPYFDQRGALVKLRPHKGGAASGTAAGAEAIYVPRDYRSVGKSAEKFYTVIICEGEFKASVLWQEIGAGAALNYGDTAAPVGVCALPGISFAKNFNYRCELEDWLLAVGCHRVIVAFDDEDKSGQPLRQRFDALKYAHYLAIDLARKLQLTGLVASLPHEWRNAKGKADWDGAMVKLLKSFPASMPHDGLTLDSIQS